MTQEQHFDVASYALGVLDERDAERFEDHLIDCPACAIELESLLPVVDILSEVDADALVATEQSRKDGLVLQQMIGEVRQERRHANSRRLYSLAAAVVVFAMLSIGALFAGGKWLAPNQPAVTVLPSSATDSKQLDPLPNPGVGLGGLDLGDQAQDKTDSRTNVSALVGFEEKDWGTQISFAVSNIKGPKKCQLVAKLVNGDTQVLSSWNVGEKGWGTADQEEPLLLQAATALPRDEIAYVQIQEVKPDGGTENLVQVP